MSRTALVTAVLPVAFFAAPTIAPAALPGLSGSVLAATNLNSSRSNIYRKKHVTGTKQGTARTTTVKSSKSNTSDRMGRGPYPGADSGHGALRASTVKSSKSNTSDRIHGRGGIGAGIGFGR